MKELCQSHVHNIFYYYDNSLYHAVGIKTKACVCACDWHEHFQFMFEKFFYLLKNDVWSHEFFVKSSVGEDKTHEITFLSIVFDI